MWQTHTQALQLLINGETAELILARGNACFKRGSSLQKHSQSQVQFLRRLPMYPRSSLLALGCLLFATTCFGQSAPGDSQTLQSLLSEVRQLRQELRAMTIAAQRSQILIYRLQGQEASVARASQRLDEAREKLARTRDARKHLAADVKQTKDFVNNTDNPTTQRKALENRLSELKTRLESSESDEQKDQSQEIDAEQQLRAEETKLSDLRDQLDRLDKTLENASRSPNGSVQ